MFASEFPLTLLVSLLLAVWTSGGLAQSCVHTAWFARGNTGFVHPDHVIRSMMVRSPIECGLVCRREAHCVSFNLQMEESQNYRCTINRHRAHAHRSDLPQQDGNSYYEMIEHSPNACVDSPCVNGGTCEESCDKPGYICHCRDSYYGENCTRGLGDSPEYAADSCQHIYSVRNDATSRPYYVKTLTPAGHSHVYCYMEKIPGCGEGGWTLVMKIDGHSNTFQFTSSLWINKVQFNENAGMGLELQETKLATFWSTSFKALCLGMALNKETRWLKVVHYATNLHEVIAGGNVTQTTLRISDWKSLIARSSLQTTCTKQGFNVHVPESSTSACARIGMIGFGDAVCSGSSDSRLGFGTSGSMYGMDDSNTCGNEARNSADLGDKSLKSFGLILVK